MENLYYLQNLLVTDSNNNNKWQKNINKLVTRLWAAGCYLELDIFSMQMGRF